MTQHKTELDRLREEQRTRWMQEEEEAAERGSLSVASATSAAVGSASQASDGLTVTPSPQDSTRTKECVVCYTSSRNYAPLHCIHTLCQPCLDKIRGDDRLRQTCPMCRIPLPPVTAATTTPAAQVTSVPRAPPVPRAPITPVVPVVARPCVIPPAVVPTTPASTATPVRRRIVSSSAPAPAPEVVLRPLRRALELPVPRSVVHTPPSRRVCSIRRSIPTTPSTPVQNALQGVHAVVTNVRSKKSTRMAGYDWVALMPCLELLETEAALADTTGEARVLTDQVARCIANCRAKATHYLNQAEQSLLLRCAENLARMAEDGVVDILVKPAVNVRAAVPAA